MAGSNWDDEKWEKEQRNRHKRDYLIRGAFIKGKSVFYKSSGNSMWPLVQSDDGCTFHPIQAVTAKRGVHSIRKEASEIGVGDIVFCQVQRSQEYYAHIVLDVQECYNPEEPKYWIGNIQKHYNGWCHRKHIFGVLVEVQVWSHNQYHSRPHPKNFSRRWRRWYGTTAGTAGPPSSVSRCGRLRAAGLRASEQQGWNS